MKKISFIFLVALLCGLLSSCSNEGIEEELQNDQAEKYELRVSYQQSTPVYGFYDDVYSNHYCGTQRNVSIIDGKPFKYENQTFNLVRTSSKFTTPLYRHYSAALNDHMLSTNSSVSSYTSQGIIGYIYPWFQIGTVRLFEYFNPKNNDHYYVSNLGEKSKLDKIAAFKDYQYQRVVGWVYPGTDVDLEKLQEYIEIGVSSPSGVSTNPAFWVTFYVTYTNANSQTLEVYHSGNVNETKSVALNRTGTISSIQMKVQLAGDSKIQTFNYANNADFLYDGAIGSGTYKVNIEQMTWQCDYRAKFMFKFRK